MSSLASGLIIFVIFLFKYGTVLYVLCAQISVLGEWFTYIPSFRNNRELILLKCVHIYI